MESDPALKYAGNKKWVWYLEPANWKGLFYSEAPARVLEIGAFEGLSVEGRD
ncbi:MAG: hypothetical protein ACI9NQ_002007 [Paracoccaceae bacterium]|jgi:hypothetical protein